MPDVPTDPGALPEADDLEAFDTHVRRRLAAACDQVRASVVRDVASTFDYDIVLMALSQVLVEGLHRRARSQPELIPAVHRFLRATADEIEALLLPREEEVRQ